MREAIAQEEVKEPVQSRVPQRFSIVVPDFSQVAPADSQKIADQLEDQLSSVTYLLLWQLRQGGLSSAVKADIIGLLGDFRVYEAIPDLIKEINFKDDRREPGPLIAPPRFHGYTARVALRLIGGDASDYILDIIGSKATGEDNEDGGFKLSQVDGFVDVLYNVEGKKWAVLKLQDRLERAKTPEAKAQYQLVLDHFQQSVTRFHW